MAADFEVSQQKIAELVEWAGQHSFDLKRNEADTRLQLSDMKTARTKAHAFSWPGMQRVRPR
jgi:hypothetical protein